MRGTFAFGLALWLGACGTTPAAITGSPDSNVRQLSLGMTPDQVSAIIGPHQYETASGTQLCRSYVYDEFVAAQFVHARFDSGALVSASDGHAVRC